MLKKLNVKKTTRFVMPLALLAGMLPAAVVPVQNAQAAVPSRGAEIPWTTYEAENMSTNGTVIGPKYDPYNEETEASGQKAVKLDADGKYVQFTASGTANSLVVRYSIPDSSGGGGQDSTISLYKNGTFVQKINVTSKYSKLYGAYPWSNSPSSGSPRNFYDEARVKLGTINPGDVIKLQKDSGDSAPYYTIDFVDLENVAPALSQPANSLSITSYGAVAGDGGDDTGALINTINAAKSQGKTVWLPAGDYNLRGTVNLSDVKIQGAGMWHTTFIGDDNYTDANRIRFNGTGSNVTLSDFAIIGKLTYRSDDEANDGIVGSFGTNSLIRNIWVEHTKVGAWVTNSNGLRFEGMRLRNTIADGINACVGMRNTTIYNSTARNTGDDSFAFWPATYQAESNAPGLNVISHVTVQTPWLAHGASVYGGESNRVEDSVFQDIPYGAGVLVSSTFPGRGFSGTTTVQRNDIIRAGGNDHGWSWRGALQFVGQNFPVASVNVNNLNITDTISNGIQFQSAGSTMTGITIDNVSINRTGLRGQGYGIVEMSGASGNATISNTSTSNTPSGGWSDQSGGFTINVGSGNSGWAGSPSPTATPTPTPTPTPAPSAVTLPGKVEAENWTGMNGVQTESTSDAGGGLNVGWIDAGDWMDYAVNVPSAGTYNVDFRVASPNAGQQVQLKSGSGSVLATVNVPNTGNWQGWTTASAPVSLSAGVQTLRVYAVTTGFNLNWLNFSTASATPTPTPTPAPTPTPTPTPTPAPGGSSTYEAESAALSGGAKYNNDHPGYTGSGFVDGYWNVGAATQFNVNAAAAGNYTATLKYGNANGAAQTLSIFVNGAKVKTTTLANLANWDTWAVQSEPLALQAGNNTIAYKYESSASGVVNIDNLTVSGGGTSTPAPTPTPAPTATPTPTPTPTPAPTPTPTPGTTNLALGKTITESSHTQVYGASNANDGNQATYWEGAANAYPSWLNVNLGSVQTVSKVVLQLPVGWGSRTQTLSILGSNDGSSYTTIVPSATYTFNPNANTVTITFTATSTRHIRVQFTANNGATSGQVSELQIY